jgi:hypothetical protein
LKGHAEIQPVIDHRCFVRTGAPGKDGRNLCARLEESRCLAVDDLPVRVLRGVRVVDVHELQHLAGGYGVGRIREDPHDPHVTDVDHHLECARIKEVTDQHTGLVAEYGVRRLLAAAPRGRVDHVVVKERRGVYEFYDGGRADVLVA